MAAPARHLAGNDVEVIEVARPNRQVRRRFGKTDVVDAIAAARAVQSGEATGVPKSHDVPVEALRTLKAVQRSGNKARTQALNQIHQLLITAPEDLSDAAAAAAPHGLAGDLRRFPDQARRRQPARHDASGAA